MRGEKMFYFFMFAFLLGVWTGIYFADLQKSEAIEDGRPVAIHNDDYLCEKLKD